jgi:hypothetical protein
VAELDPRKARYPAARRTSATSIDLELPKKRRGRPKGWHGRSRSKYDDIQHELLKTYAPIIAEAGQRYREAIRELVRMGEAAVQIKVRMPGPPRPDGRSSRERWTWRIMRSKDALGWVRAGRAQMPAGWKKAAENRLMWQWEHNGSAILAEVKLEELRLARENAADEVFAELKLTT